MIVPDLAADLRTMPLSWAYNITSLNLWLPLVGNLTDSKQVLNSPIYEISHESLFSSYIYYSNCFFSSCILSFTSSNPPILANTFVRFTPIFGF